jgi:hypothetical protein
MANAAALELSTNKTMIGSASNGLSHPLQQSANLCRSLLNITSASEAGLAETPLSDAVSLLLERSEHPSLRVTVVGLTQSAQSQAVHLLIGSEAAFHVCQIVTPQSGGCGYLEITLRDRGFLLDSGGERKEFESVESLIEVLKHGDPIKLRSSLAEPLRLGLAGSPGRNGLTLLLPEGLQELKSKPGLFSYLADHSDVLLLAGKSADDLSDEDRGVVEDLLGGVGAVQSLVFADTSGSVPTWSKLGAALRFPTARSRSFITAPCGPMRHCLAASGRIAQMHGVPNIDVCTSSADRPAYVSVA